MSKQARSSSIPPKQAFEREGRLTAREKPIGYGALLRANANFRWLWGGQVVSLLGDWFNTIASATLIAKLTGSGLAVGFLFTIRMLAPFTVAPLAGIYADRYNRKHLLIITDVVRAFLVFGFLFVQDESDIWLLYTLTGLLFAVSGFFSPARSAILPDITSPRELGTANALGAVTWSVMLAFGAMIGGLTTGIFGIYTALIVDGLTFLVSAGFLLGVNLPGASSATAGARTRSGQSALRYLLHYPDILFIAMHKAAIALLMSSGFQVAQVEIAKNYFVIGVGGAIGLGLLYGVNGVGSGIGPILARHWTGDRDKPLRMSISLGYLIGAIGITLTAPLFNWTAVLIGGFVRSVGGGIVWVFSTQLLLQRAPNEIRGRVFGTEFALFTLMGGIGTAIVGAAIDLFQDVRIVLWAMAFLPLIPAVLWWLWQFRRSRTDS